MTDEQAKDRMLEYNGKYDYCDFRYPQCENHDCPSDEEIIKKILEVEK